jgi:hypothetical protein
MCKAIAPQTLSTIRLFLIGSPDPRKRREGNESAEEESPPLEKRQGQWQSSAFPVDARQNLQAIGAKGPNNTVPQVVIVRTCSHDAIEARALHLHEGRGRKRAQEGQRPTGSRLPTSYSTRRMLYCNRFTTASNSLHHIDVHWLHLHLHLLRTPIRWLIPKSRADADCCQPGDASSDTASCPLFRSWLDTKGGADNGGFKRGRNALQKRHCRRQFVFEFETPALPPAVIFSASK